MDELIKTFHIDYKLLAAQMVNFAVVVAVLYKFAYKPLLKKMDERTGTIEKGLKDAKESGEKLELAMKEREEKIRETKKEARQIIEEAQEQAQKSQEEVVSQAKLDAEKVVEQAKKQIQNEKEKMVIEIKKEIGTLVVTATKKIIDEKMDNKKDEEMIAKTIGEMKN